MILLGRTAAGAMVVGATGLLGLGMGLGGAGAAADAPVAVPIRCPATLTDGPDMVVAYGCDRARGEGEHTVTTASGTYRCNASVQFFVDPFREVEAEGIDPGHRFVGGACTRV